MESHNYSLLLSKTFLWVGRCCGFTFCRVQITSSSQLISKNNLFSQQRNKKWNCFGKVLVPFVLAFCVFRSIRIFHRVEKSSQGTLIDILYVAGMTVYFIHYFSCYLVGNCFGKVIFNFLVQIRLTRNQFRIGLLVLISPMATILLRHALYLSELAAINNMNIGKQTVSELLIFATDVPWAFGTSLRLLLSLVTYWELKSHCQIGPNTKHKC